jgi:DNA-binding MarR family transcriptional regulator
MAAEFFEQSDYRSMADLRYQVRRFLRFSENAAREGGMEPQQYQLLLAVKGLPEGTKPTVGALAERMQLQHHSTVGLINRLVERGLLVRFRATDDKRQVLVKLSLEGEAILSALALHHLQELRSVGPTFVTVLKNLLEDASRQVTSNHNKKVEANNG